MGDDCFRFRAGAMAGDEGAGTAEGILEANWMCAESTGECWGVWVDCDVERCWTVAAVGGSAMASTFVAKVCRHNSRGDAKPGLRMLPLTAMARGVEKERVCLSVRGRVRRLSVFCLVRRRRAEPRCVTWFSHYIAHPDARTGQAAMRAAGTVLPTGAPRIPAESALALWPPPIIKGLPMLRVCRELHATSGSPRVCGYFVGNRGKLPLSALLPFLCQR